MSAKNERGNLQVSGKILNENNADDIYFDADSWKQFQHGAHERIFK